MEEWTGIDALTQLSGTSSSHPPIRALFLAHRVGASGRLWMTRDADICSIELFEGRIVGCAGFTALMEGHTGERQWSVDEWVDVQMSAGQARDEGLKAVAVSLCSAALVIEAEGDWVLNFVPTSTAPDQVSTIPVPLSESIQAAISATVSDGDVRTWFEGAAVTGLSVHRPIDSPVECWGLDSTATRLLEAAEENPTVGGLFVEIGADGWGGLGVLWKLGLIQVDKARQETPVASPDPPESERKAAEEVQRPASKKRPRPPAVEPPQEAAPAAGTSTQSKKKRRLDPRLVALKRNPSESPAQKQEDHLKAAHDVIKRSRPEFIFRIRKVADLNSQQIDRRHREACARYHPDRYRHANQGVRVLAEGCFTLISDAYHKLKDNAYQEALRVRLVERETGVKVVTDKTRSRARVDFAKAEALFKQKRYDNAFRMAGKAVEGDPDRWQHHYVYFRAGHRAGELALDVVSSGILSLQGMTTVEKGDQIYTLGEINMREGDDATAYKLFRQAVSLDEKNVGALRRLRLRDRRDQVAKEPESGGGLFGGLFQRRK